MSKQRAAILCGCVAALPLLMGCANGGGQAQAYAAPPRPAAAAFESANGPVYAVAPAQPAAILVMLPGPGDMPGADPRLWTAQGFDVVTPPSSELYQLAAAQQAAATQLIAEARAMAAAPIWLIGPNPQIEAAMAAMPPAGAGQVSGVVVTSTTSGNGTCSERMIYSYPGNGEPPKVAVTKSGNACPTGAPFAAGANPTAVPPPMPAVRPRGPHLIEANARPGETRAAGQAMVQRIADLIKATPRS